MTDCLFCKIITGKLPSQKIYEDEHTFAFLDIRPLNDGHTLVIPKEHFDHLLIMPKEVFTQTMNTVHYLAPIIKEAVGADGINIHINTLQPAGQVVDHFHVHIIPRQEKDGYVLWHPLPKNYDDLEAVRNKILPHIPKN